MRSNGEDYYYLYDGKGNVTAVVDSSSQVVATYQYNGFGRLMSSSGSLDQPFMFSTKRYDQGTGLSYYGYRFYAPVIERWLNRDPLGEAGGINLYGFVRNDPVDWVDPWGLFNTRPMVMRNLPIHPYSTEHTRRNRYNRCPRKPPRECKGGGYKDYEGHSWEKDNWFTSGYYHGGWSKGYRTWRNPATGSQCTYNKQGNLVDSGKYMGTYDYKNPQTDGILEHRNYDVVPHDFNPNYEPGLTEQY